MRKAKHKVKAVEGAETKLKIRHVIVCDDVRQEISGKEILIGVYNDILIFPGFPALMESLFFRIAATCPIKLAGEYRFALVGPNDKKVFEVSNSLAPVPSQDENRIFNLAFRGVPFVEEGIYQIHFGVNGPARKIWQLMARLPHGDIEKQRLRPNI